MEKFNCSCGFELDESISFCPTCGKKVEIPLASIKCSNCDFELAQDAKFCSKCGAKNELQTQNVETEQITQEAPVQSVESVQAEEQSETAEISDEQNNELSDLLPNEQGDETEKIDEDGQTENTNSHVDENIDEQIQVQPLEEIPNIAENPIVEQKEVAEEITTTEHAQFAGLDQVDNNTAELIEVETTVVQAEAVGGRGSRVLKAIVSVFLSLIIFLLILGIQLIFTVRSTFNEENIEKAINEIDISELEIPKAIIEATVLDGVEVPEDQTLSEYILLIMDPDIVEQYDITTKKIEKIFDENFFKDFLKNNIVSFTDDVFNETDEGKVSSKDVTKFIEKNADRIEKITSYHVSDEDIEKISDFFAENEIIEKISISKFRNEEPGLMSSIKFGFSYFLVCVLIVLALLSAFAIFWVNKKRPDSSFYYLGSSTICSGAVIVVAGILSNAISKIIKSIMGEYFALVKPMTEVVYKQLILSGLITLGIGILLILTSIIISKVRKTKA